MRLQIMLFITLDGRPGVNCIGRWQIFSILPIAAPAMGTASADSWKNRACNLSVLFTPVTMPILSPGFINAHMPYFFLIDLRREQNRPFFITGFKIMRSFTFAISKAVYLGHHPAQSIIPQKVVVEDGRQRMKTDQPVAQWR